MKELEHLFPSSFLELPAALSGSFLPTALSASGLQFSRLTASSPQPAWPGVVTESRCHDYYFLCDLPICCPNLCK